VLVIGEIRDEETANIAVRAALTGHLVISTLHAGSCHGVFERLLVMCADHSAVASAIEMVLNQRLIRRLCGSCRGGGCSECLQTGYRGLVPLIEWLRINETLRGQIRRQEARSVTLQRSLEASAQELLKKSVTNEVEYRRVLGL
jgi:type II secretory ATPase GspE/PulE/Tfp pilus assembly ATPase PilB-like protein